MCIRDSGTTVRISESATGVQANGQSGTIWDSSCLSPDGRWCVFHSDATNLVAPGGPGNDVFLRDLWNGPIELVSLGNGGVSGLASSVAGVLSADARFI